jgi:hypothetical protein
MLVQRKPEKSPADSCFIAASKHKVFLVDADDYEKQRGYYWRAKKKSGNWYAYRRVVRDGKAYEIALHRTIARSRPDEEPHHKNHNTFDNRKENLENVPHDKHPHN